MSSESFLIVIPSGCTSDIHVCGVCKAQFCVLDKFFSHKFTGTCSAVDGENAKFETGRIPDCWNAINDLDKSSLKNAELCVNVKNTGNAIPGVALTKKDRVPLEIASRLSLPESSKLSEGELKMNETLLCNFAGCSYKSFRKKDFERHLRIHTGERPYKCTKCPKSFNRRDKLLVHERVHNGDKKFKCSMCSYACIDSGRLIKHVRTHNGDRPFKCQLCSYRSRNSSQLTVHLRMHTGDSPYMCTHESCKAVFKTHSDLKRHTKIHCAEKKYSCSFCPYKSNLKFSLKKHIFFNHPEGKDSNLNCKLCTTNLQFSTIRKFRNHMKKYHIETVTESFKLKAVKNKAKGEQVGTLAKGFVCNLCNATFVCKTSLETHERFHDKIKQDLDSAVRRTELENNRPVVHQPSNVTRNTVCRSQLKDGEDIILDKRNLQDNLQVGESYLESFEESLRTAELLASFTQQMQNSRHFELSSNILTSMTEDLHSVDLGIT